jgi:hypothetical protein
MSKRDISQILDDCLTRIQSGESTPEDCLRMHPQDRSTLDPLLISAGDVRDHLPVPEPRAEYIAQSKARILNQLAASQRTIAAPRLAPTRPRRRILRPAFALASLALVLVLLASGVGVVNASAESLPGDVLYTVKRGFEEVRLALTLNSAADQQLLLEMADKRLEEIEQAFDEDRENDANIALRGYQRTVDRILVATGKVLERSGPGSLSHVQEKLQYHQQVLMMIMARKAYSENEGLENALEGSRHASDVIERARRGESPSELAPGKNKNANEDAGSGPANGKGKNKPGKEKTPKGSERTPGPRPTKTPRPTKDR